MYSSYLGAGGKESYLTAQGGPGYELNPQGRFMFCCLWLIRFYLNDLRYGDEVTDATRNLW